MTKIINVKKAIPLVKYFTAAFSSIIIALLLSGVVTQAFAADLAAVLVPDRDKTEPSFKGVKTITLRYPEGSSIAAALSGTRMEFSLKGTANQQDDTGMAQLIAAVNKGLLEAQSPVVATAAEVVYTAVVRVDAKSAIINYKVELKPTLENFVLQRGEGGQSGHIIDLEWRGFVVNGPIVVNSPEGQIDVNRAIGLFQLKYPDVAEKLLNSQAREIMEDPIMDFKDFDVPMKLWQFLFDPVGSYGGGVGLQGTEGAQVLSVFALGESSLREGVHVAEEKDVVASIDGVQVDVHSNNPPPTAQIQIAGYAADQESEGGEFATVTSQAP
ncbi:MAG: hypothetical protein ACREAQ_06695, partial [Nitrososphaera sp.]